MLEIPGVQWHVEDYILVLRCHVLQDEHAPVSAQSVLPHLFAVQNWNPRRYKSGSWFIVDGYTLSHVFWLVDTWIPFQLVCYFGHTLLFRCSCGVQSQIHCHSFAPILCSPSCFPSLWFWTHRAWLTSTVCGWYSPVTFISLSLCICWQRRIWSSLHISCELKCLVSFIGTPHFGRGIYLQRNCR